MKRINYSNGPFSPNRWWILRLVFLSLWMNFAWMWDGMGQVTNRSASGTEYTQSWNSFVLSDNTHPSTRSDFAEKLDHINYKGNIYVLYKNSLDHNLVNYFDDEFNLPSDYIFFWFTKNKNGTWKGEGKVSVFVSSFRDESKSKELQNKFTAWLKSLKAHSNLNQTSVLQLAYEILKEEYWIHSQTWQNNSSQGGSQDIDNSNLKNTSNVPEEEDNGNIYIWIFGILIVLGWWYLLHRKYPNLFLAAEPDWEMTSEKSNKSDDLDEKLQSDIIKLEKLVKQYELLSERASEFSYILPDNIQEILNEAYERVKIFQNAVSDWTFKDNKGLLWTSLWKAWKVKEDLSLTENVLKWLEEMWYCASIMEEIEYLKNEIENIENESWISDKQIAAGQNILSELEQKNSSRIRGELEFDGFEKIKSAKIWLIKSTNIKLEEYTWENTSTNIHTSWNLYEEILNNPEPDSNSPSWKEENRKSPLDNREYLPETLVDITDYRDKFETVKTRLIWFLESITTLKERIESYEAEFTSNVRKFEVSSREIESKKTQYPQFESINKELTWKITSSKEFLNQANSSHEVEKKDRPTINNSLNQAMQLIQEVEDAYKKFHRAKEDYLTNIGRIKTKWMDLAIYINDTDYNSLPEYISQPNLAQKIDQLSDADTKKEDWIKLYDDSVIIWSTLVELKDEFEEYKKARTGYKSNLMAISTLNVRLIDLASDAWRTYQQVVVIPEQWNRFTLKGETDTILKQMRLKESDFEDDISRASNSTVVIIWWGNSWGWLNNWNDDDNSGWSNDSGWLDPTPDYANNDTSWAWDEI